MIVPFLLHTWLSVGLSRISAPETMQLRVVLSPAIKLFPFPIISATGSNSIGVKSLAI